MKADPTPSHAHAHAQGSRAQEPHAHAPHGHAPHGHGTHAHTHEPGHHGNHTHAPPPAQADEPRSSLLMRSAPWRLAGAVALIAVLWAAVAWALSGTP